MGKRSKREAKKAGREANQAVRAEAEARREAEVRELWRDEIRSQRCPVCGSGGVGRYFYGMPDFAPAMVEERDEGLLILAGCSSRGSDPIWRCRACGHEWGTLGPLFKEGP